MQALLLAAGQSSRMYPFATDEHKSMIKLLGKPILEHVVVKLKNKDITEIVIVVGKNNNIESHFGDGSRFGVGITYVVQEKPLGAGNAILLAKPYLKDDFLLLNSYHVEIDKFIDELLLKSEETSDGVLLVKERENVSNYGVVKIDGDKVIDIVEKPEAGSKPSNLCIIGIYLLSSSFMQILDSTPDEHYQLESALNRFVKEKNIGFVKTDEESVVLKYPWDLLAIKNYLLSEIKSHRGENIEIAENVEITGEVYIEDDVKILEGACIKGPCYLGKGSYVGSNALLRGGVDLEANAVAGSYMEIKNSIIMENSTTHSGFLGDSVIGNGVKIGAGVNTANVRLDRLNIKTLVKEEKVDSGLRQFGAIIGENCRIGITVSIMPGIIIGTNVVIGPSTTVLQNVGDNKKYYTKFQEIIENNNN